MSDNLDDFFPVPIAELYHFFVGLLDIFFMKGPQLSIAAKDSGELVSSVDKAVEKQLLAFLSQHYPGFDLVSEESCSHWPPRQGDFCVVDPVDGTHNLVMGATMFGSMFAVFADGEPVRAGIFLPLRHLANQGGLLVAARGRGAFEIFGNGSKPQRLQVSSQSSLKKAAVLFEAPQRRRAGLIFRRTVPKVVRTRQFGSAACSAALVAAGGTVSRGADALILIAIKPWDLWPAALLVTEAGGKATDLDDKALDLQSQSALLSNGRLHRRLIELSRRSKR